MFARERQEKIYEQLQKSGAVTTSGLVNAFHVSIETIRRDLLAMELQGRLSRVHGGAVAKKDMKPFFDLKKRSAEQCRQKSEISFKAMDCISNGDIIGVDAGSTAVLFAEALKEHFSRLTVITHSLDVFRILCDCEGFSLILCGGHYLREEHAFFGALTLDMLKNLHMQKAFVFPSALSLEYGICDYQEDLYPIQKQLIQSSDDIFVLADSSKFEKKALLKVEEMKKTYTYVTDSDLPEELLQLYRENDRIIYKGENSA